MMKKTKKSRLLTYLLAMVMTIGLFAVPSFAASPSDTYNKGYTIESVLSQFQFFVEGDANLSNAHTVGAIAVGGTYVNKSNTFGDAAIVPSYIGEYKEGNLGTGWQKLSRCTDVFYGSVAEGSSLPYNPDDPNTGNWMQNANYMDMEAAFTSLRAQSEEMGSQGTTVSVSDIADNGTLTLQCATDSDYFIIPYDVYKAANIINIKTPAGEDVNWFQHNLCVINITGIGDEGAKLDDTSDDPVMLDNWYKVQVDGVHMSQAFEHMSGYDKQFQSQLNFSGFNFVLNLPDATGEIYLNGLGGHLIAPNATVDMGNSNYEGGIIAKSIKGSSQGHFYPMNKVIVPPVEGELTTLTFYKRAADKGSNNLEDAVLKISSDDSLDLSDVEEVTTPNLGAQLGDNNTSITWTSAPYPLQLKGLPDGKYTLTELEAPGNYDIADPIKFMVDGGKIREAKNDTEYYETKKESLTMTDSLKASDNPGAVCEFSKRASDAKDSSDLKNAYMKLEADVDLSGYEKLAGPTPDIQTDNNVITWKTSTTPLKLSNLPDGSYTLSETKEPDGYEKAASISFEIKDSKVIYNEEVVTKITMIDEKIPEEVKTFDATFSKIDATNSKEIDDAELKLTSDNADIKDVTTKNPEDKAKYDFSNSEGTITWKSNADAPLTLTGLPAGTYKLVEVTWPNGYEKADDIEFTISATGKIMINGQEKSQVQMKDDPTTTDTFDAEFSKIIAGTSTELPGATLQLTSTNDKDLSGVTTKNPADAESEDIDFNNYEGVISWKSTGSALVLTGLPAGSYKLEELHAPTDYVKAEAIEFSIDSEGNLVDADGKPIAKIVMEDAEAEEEGVECSFSKKALSILGDELEGADITLTADVDLKKVEQLAGPDVAKNENSDGKVFTISWTSSTVPVKLSGLPDGTYAMHEESAPDGYELAKTDIVFTITDGKVYVVTASGNEEITGDNKTISMVDELLPTATCTFSKKELSGEISELLGAGGDELPGASIELTSNVDLSDVVKVSGPDITTVKNNDGTVKKITWTSGTEAVKLKNLPDGEYAMHEEVAPAGYLKKKTDIEFKIDSGKVYVKTVDGYSSDESDAIYMFDKAIDGEFSKVIVATTTELPEAHLKLTSTDGTDLSNVTTKNESDIATYSFDNNEGVITWISQDEPLILTKLPAGSYELEETKAPDNYAKAESITFTITDEGIIKDADGKTVSKVKMEDSLAPVVSDYTFSKKALKVGGDELPGAELTLTCDVDMSEDLVYRSNPETLPVLSADGKTISWTSESESLVIGGLPDGNYVMHEEAWPTGYLQATDIIFKIEGGVLKIKEGDDWVTPEDATVYMVDEREPVTYDAKMSKTDFVTTDELPGAKLSLTRKDGTDISAVTTKNAEDIDTYKFDNDGTTVTWTSTGEPLEITKLPAGVYEFTEITAPNGYKKAETVEFEITEDGKLKQDGKDVEKVTMEDKPIDGTFSKKDSISTGELPGADLQLTNTDGTDISNITTKNEEDIDTYSFENDGTTITWTSTGEPLVLTKLPAGNYEFTEFTAPDGYKKAETVEFEITEDGKLKQNGDFVDVIVMFDEPIDGKFSKIDSITKDELPGAEIKLTNTDGTDLSNVTTKNEEDIDTYSFKNDGTTITWTSTGEPLVLTKLPAGSYKFTEITAPNGYKKAETVEFEITEDGKLMQDGNEVDKITMEDEPKPTYDGKFSKVEVTTTNELSGAELTLVSTDGTDLSNVTTKNEADVTKYTFKNNKGVITWISQDEPLILTKLPAGDYKFTEESAPDGYKKAEESIEFTIDADGKLLLDGEEVDAIVMEDAPITVTGATGTFSKKALSESGNELAGADIVLELTSDGDLAEVEQTAGPTVNKVEDNDVVKMITWTSTTTAVKLTGLPNGEYKFHEEAAPNGYLKTTDIEFKIEEGKIYLKTENGYATTETTNLKLVDEAIEGEFSKVIFGSSDELPGAGLTLTNTDGTPLENVTTKNPADVAKYGFDSDGATVSWTSKDQSLVLTAIPAGNYEFTETTTPGGYLKAETIVFEINEDGELIRDGVKVQSIVMEDKPIPTFDGEFSKVIFNTSDELPEARLSLVANEEGLDISAVTTKNEEDIDTYNFKNEDGVITWESQEQSLVLTKLPAGKYKFTETAAPDGYLQSEAVEFEITDDGKLKQNGEVVDKIIMEDEPVKTFDGEFSKIIFNTSDELPGAEISITSEDAYLGFVTTKNPDDVTTYKFTNDGSKVAWESQGEALILTGLPAGTYTFTEDRAPDGYVKAESITFTISSDGKLMQDGKEVTTIVMEDKEETSAGAEGIFSKKALAIGSTEFEELEGADIVLTADVDLKNVEQTEGPDVDMVEESDGTVKTIKWTSTTIAVKLTGLPDGNYMMHEEAAPLGYLKTTDVEFKIEGGKIFIKISEDDYDTEEATGAMMFDRAIDGEFSKVDATNGEELPDAKLSLESTDGTDISGVTTKNPDDIDTYSFANKDGVITWISQGEALKLTKLPIGSYKLTETKAPDNYSVAEAIEFSIDEDGNLLDAEGEIIDAVVMEDELTATCTFSKKAFAAGVNNPADFDELDGAYIELTADVDMKDVTQTAGPTVATVEENDGSVKKLTWTSTGEAVELSGLPSGNYKMHEEAAPLGYLKTTAIEFKVEDGMVFVKTKSGYDENALTTIFMVDKAIDGEFSKVDATSGEELPGAKLSLSSTDGTDISGITTKNPDDIDTYSFENDGTTAVWFSQDETLVLTKIPAGSYELEELKAPDNYDTAENVKFSIDEDGNMFDEDDNPIDVVVMEDKLLEDTTATGTFSKKALSTESNQLEELPGAKITVTYVSGDNDLSDVEQVSGPEATITATKVSWISGNEPVVLTELPEGEYVMHEVAAPKGYVKASDIKFKVEGGEIYRFIDGEYSNDSTDEIVMIDERDEDDTTTEETTTEEKTTEDRTTDEKTTEVTTETTEITTETTTEVTTNTSDKNTTDNDKDKLTSDSDKDKKNTSTTDTEVHTGDDFNGVVPIVIMLLAAAGIIICEDRKKKIW